jgi:hypothetical protein
VLTVTYLFRLLAAEFSQWFEGKADPEDHDIIQEARVGRNALVGRFLEIVSSNPQKRWWRSTKARMRLFMREAQSAHGLIAQAAGIKRTMPGE